MLKRTVKLIRLNFLITFLVMVNVFLIYKISSIFLCQYLLFNDLIIKKLLNFRRRRSSLLRVNTSAIWYWRNCWLSRFTSKQKSRKTMRTSKMKSSSFRDWNNLTEKLFIFILSTEISLKFRFISVIYNDPNLKLMRWKVWRERETYFSY